MSKETGGSAFPVTAHPNGGPLYNGMTLRDYFAAKAMQVFLNKESLNRYGLVSEQAYLIADAMIEERNK